MRVQHKRFPWLVGHVIADHGSTATVQWDQNLPDHWALEAWHDLRATPVQPR